MVTRSTQQRDDARGRRCSCHCFALALMSSVPATVRAGNDVASSLPLRDLILPLFLVVALGLLAAWISTRRSGWLRRITGGTGPLRLIQALPLGARERLVIVRVEREGQPPEDFLLSATPQRIALVDRLDRVASANRPADAPDASDSDDSDTGGQ